MTKKTDDTIEAASEPTTTTTTTGPAEELMRLREHNKQLLGELKATKADAKTATEALEAAQARLHVLLVEQPLAALAERVSPHPAAFTRILRDHIDVVLDGDAPALRTKDGKPLIRMKDRKEVTVAFDAVAVIDWLNEAGPADLRELLNKPQGTNAPGSRGGWRAGTASAVPATPQQRAPLPFGLR